LANEPHLATQHDTKQESAASTVNPLKETCSNLVAPPEYDTPEQLDQESLGRLRQFFELLAAWDEKEREQ